jgi:methionyl-tRNA formyltransferase
VDNSLVTKEPLRIGLFLDSFVVENWVRRVVEEIQASSFAKVVLVVMNNCEAPSTKILDRLSRSHDQILYGLYTKFDNRFARVNPNAFELVDIGDLCPNVPVLKVKPLMKKFSDRFADQDVDQILEHKLDVVLRFGFRILRGRSLDTAKHGVWSYHHDDSLRYKGGPPGFWEVMQDDPVTGSMLQILTEDLDNGQVLYRSWAPTLNRFSVKKNNNNYYWKTAAFIGRRLRELHRDGRVTLVDEAQESAPRPYNAPLYKVPRNREMCRLLWNLGRRAVKRTVEKLLYTETWSLAFHFKNNKEKNEALHRFTKLIPPPGHFWADPFPVKVEDRFFVFFEDFVYSDNKAVIAMIELRKDGSFDQPATVLECDYHLSYPFLFEWNNSLYMIPETGGNNTVELYRCTWFPLEWEKEKVLLTANNPSDATLIELDGKWWMFVNIQEPGVTVNWEELHIYFADSPLGPWTPHAQNPVRSDVRNSRPAGKLFFHDGQLIRPAQDCSKRYGYATALNRVRKLNCQEFQEDEVAKIIPEWDRSVIGTHTLNRAEELTVIDCLVRRRRLF